MGTKTETKAAVRTGAGLLVASLEAQGVKHVFGIPGAKIDKVFDTLADSSIQTIVCRHEQNTAFIAGGIGRMTGKAGEVLVTSGPGVSNLASGLATATTEGDPVGVTSRNGILRTLRLPEGRCWVAERSEASFCYPSVDVPGVVAG